MSQFSTQFKYVDLCEVDIVKFSSQNTHGHVMSSVHSTGIMHKHLKF